MGSSGGTREGAIDVTELAIRPTGSIAETHDRSVVGGANLAVLTTGQLYLQALALPAGKTITSISYQSATTAAVLPLNVWFALFSAARGVLGVTVDDTDTGWGANTVKTLALGARVADAVTNTDTSLTSATAAFVAGDVGVAITGAGIPDGTTILSRTNATTVVLSQATTATATGVKISWARAVTYSVTTTGLYYVGIMVKATTAPTLRGVAVSATTSVALAPITMGTADGSLVEPATCPATASTITAAVNNPYAYVS